MLQIGIISDIHANLDGLNLALDFFEEQQVDEIWCAGDLVDRGVDGDAVVKRVRYAQIPTVQGNHDHMARRAQERMKKDINTMLYPPDYPNSNKDDHQMILSSELSEVNLTYLDYLPVALKFERDGMVIEMTHTNTFDNITYIYPTSRHELFYKTLHSSVADMIILGHTHYPMRVYLDGDLRIINSGSVYKNYGLPAQSCGILTLPDRKFTVYDIMTKQAVPVPTVHLESQS